MVVAAVACLGVRLARFVCVAGHAWEVDDWSVEIWAGFAVEVGVLAALAVQEWLRVRADPMYRW